MKIMLLLLSLFHTIDPSSLSKNLAFYELYPDTEEGQVALSRAAHLLSCQNRETVARFNLLLNRKEAESLTDSELYLIEKMASGLPNRRLKGYQARSESEVLLLPSEEIDLGSALVLSQYGEQEGAFLQARRYSALLDLMALQILAQLPKQASYEEKIRKMNHFIFDEMHFRFPPHSIYAQDIDLYTFLPSVMDNHLGVCLGVTAMYIALAQRLDLPLEIVTPPGHIYVRCCTQERIINIETTARGIDVPSEQYLGMNTRKLQLREVKEVVGMIHVNQASTYLHRGEYEKALKTYQKAYPYLPEDALLNELLGYSYLLVGEEKRGREHLEKIKDVLPEEAVIKRALAEDFLAGKTDLRGIRALFERVDENRESIIKKKETLEEIVACFPEFRDGLQMLATCWIQLQRYKEAIQVLEKHHLIDAHDPEVEYYLGALYAERYDFKNSWKHLKIAETIVKERGFSPKALRALRRELLQHCPE